MTKPATSPYLSLRQAVRPAIFAHQLLAGDAERAGELAAECEELLLLTRELLKAAGQALSARRLWSAGFSPMSLNHPQYWECCIIYGADLLRQHYQSHAHAAVWQALGPTDRPDKG